MKEIMACTKKICSGQMGHFGPENGVPKNITTHNSGLALIIFLKLCRMKGANRYMKTLIVVFFEKKSHLGQFDLFSL